MKNIVTNINDYKSVRKKYDSPTLKVGINMKVEIVHSL